MQFKCNLLYLHLNNSTINDSIQKINLRGDRRTRSTRQFGRRLVEGAGLGGFQTLSAVAEPPGRRCRNSRGGPHRPLARGELPHRNRLARRRRHGPRMPPPLGLRQRRRRGHDERMRRPHGEDIRPPVGTGRLRHGRLPPPPADHRRTRKNGRRLRRGTLVGDRRGGKRLPHRRGALHPRGPHRQRSRNRRRLDPRKRDALRRRARRRGRQGLRPDRRRRVGHRQRLDRRTLLRRRKLPAGQGFHSRRVAVLRQLALRKRRGRLDLRRSLHRLAPQIVAADRRHVLVLQRRQRLEPEQPPLQERRRAPVGAPARLQVRQQRLHHVARARGRLHDGHGTPLLPPRHLGLPLLLSDREGRAHAPHAGRQPHQFRRRARHREVARPRPPLGQTRRDQFRRIQSLHHGRHAPGRGHPPFAPGAGPRRPGVHPQQDPDPLGGPATGAQALQQGHRGGVGRNALQRRVGPALRRRRAVARPGRAVHHGSSPSTTTTTPTAGPNRFTPPCSGTRRPSTRSTRPSPRGTTPTPRCAARPTPTATATVRSTWPSATVSTARAKRSAAKTTTRSAA